MRKNFTFKTISTMTWQQLEVGLLAPKKLHRLTYSVQLKESMMRPFKRETITKQPELQVQRSARAFLTMLHSTAFASTPISHGGKPLWHSPFLRHFERRTRRSACDQARAIRAWTPIQKRLSWDHARLVHAWTRCRIALDQCAHYPCVEPITGDQACYPCVDAMQKRRL
jgi:hypothetical protein